MRIISAAECLLYNQFRDHVVIYVDQIIFEIVLVLTGLFDQLEISFLIFSGIAALF